MKRPRPHLAGRLPTRPYPTLWLLLLLLLGGRAAHAQRPQLRLDLLPGSGAAPDPTYVYFEPGATTGFDPALDAVKLPNSSGLNLASFEADGQALAINGLPPDVLSAAFTVPLFVGVPQDDTYTLQVGQLDNFTTTTLYLLDNLQNTSTPLALGTAYTFELTAANTAGTYQTSTRFALQFAPGAGPLPVVLASFSAGVQPPGVRVAWRTASEWHSQYFAVERSPDGQAFGELGRVAAAGTSGQPRSYELLDAQPLAGAAYYRLRQVDLDGRVQYSPVRVVGPGAAPGGLRLFPNPARAATTLLGAAPGVGVAVLDAQGRLVATATTDAAGRAGLALPAGLASGLYVVRAAGQLARLVVE